MKKYPRPSPDEVIRIRESVQAEHGLGITAAQDWCAAALRTSLRAFQQWERGERSMHPAFFDLLQHKILLKKVFDTKKSA